MQPEQAWKLLEQHLEPLGTTTVERRNALGRVLSEPLSATVDVPPLDVSAMDGYAYAGEVEKDDHLPVKGLVAAGEPPGLALDADAAVAIMTGAPVPAAADRVIPIELTDGGRDTVIIRRPVEADANIRRQGEVLQVGDPVLARGARLSPAALALIATHGFGTVPVYRPPSVAVLTTGDEVVPPDTTPGPGQLRDSHTDFLLSAGRRLDLAFRPLGIAPDEPRQLSRLIEKGLGADVLLIGGGVSMGQFDFVEGVLADLGCRVVFDHVDIQPGKPLVAATHQDGLVFGLPGNPASVMACFWLFVRPALRRLQGIADRFWKGALTGELASELPGAKGRDRFLPAVIDFKEEGLRVTVPRPRGSHDLAAFALGSALVRIRAGSSPAPVGAPCEILPLVDWTDDDGSSNG